MIYPAILLTRNLLSYSSGCTVKWAVSICIGTRFVLVTMTTLSKHAPTDDMHLHQTAYLFRRKQRYRFKADISLKLSFIFIDF
jgi:hypothetical protein